MKSLDILIRKKWALSLISVVSFLITCVNILALTTNSNDVSKFKYIQFFAFFPVLQALCSVFVVCAGAFLAQISRNAFFVSAMIVNAILNFSIAYGCLYQIGGLYFTHCADIDTVCKTVATHNGFDMFYFSITTLTTLGIGDYIPANNFGRVLVETEAVIGYLVLALSIAAFTNLLRYKD